MSTNWKEGFFTVVQTSERSISPTAAALHRQAVVVDAHADTLQDVLAGRRHLWEQSREGHVDIPRLLAGGVDLQVFPIWVDPSAAGHLAATRQALRLIDSFYREVVHTPRLWLVRSRSDLQRVGRPGCGQVAALLSLEGGEPLAGSLELLDLFFQLGIRLLGLTWNGRNELADGVEEAEAGGGLTRLGRQVVQRMTKLGMVLDVSHLSNRGFWDALEVYSGPLIASHSNCRVICNHPRNLTDAQIQALAQHDGVMGINFLPAFLRPDAQQLPARIEDIVRHIDHIVDLVGPEHVGLGSDFDGISKTPVELPDVSHLPLLTEALLAHGYRPEDVEDILGGNFLRVFAQTLP
ncbi:MAG: dipeptidase [Limnochordaceae bacterium]|nr:dipeptidase [Limnochordaceae bacterium]